MPFLLVTGHPSCGKSTIVDRLSEYFKESGKDVTVIKDEDNSAFSRSIFNDSQKVRMYRDFYIHYIIGKRPSFVYTVVSSKVGE